MFYLQEKRFKGKKADRLKVNGQSKIYHEISKHKKTRVAIVFFLRKISPKLTSATSPLFTEEDWL